MTAVPRRLLILGGGPVGVEMAQAVRRLGGEVALVDRRRARARATSPHHWARRSARSCAATASSWCSARARRGARRDGDEYVLERRRRPRAARRPPARRDRSPAAGRRHRARDRRHRAPTPDGIPVDTRPARRRRALGDRRRHRHLAADDDRQVPGRHRRREHPRRAARSQLRGPPARRLHRSAGRGGRRARGALHAPARRSPGCARTATYTRAYAESNGFLTLLSDGDAADRCLRARPEAGEWLQQATLAIRAHVPLDVLRDTIQPFPTFSEIYADALKALRAEIAAGRS